MAVSWQNIPISLIGGVDTKTDFKQVVPGRLLTLENGVFTSLQEISKRNGYGSLPLTLSSGAMISEFQDELIALDGKNLYSYTPNLGTATNKGPFTSVGETLTSVIRNSASQGQPDVAYHSSGLKLVTWFDSRGGGNRYSIIDAVTEDNIVYDQLVNATASQTKPFALGNYFIILYQDTATNFIYYVAIPIATPSSPSAPVLIASDTTPFSGVALYDATFLLNRLYITWYNSAVTPGVSIAYLDTGLVLSAESQYAGITNLEYITIWADSVLNQLWVSAADPLTSIKYMVVSSSLASVLPFTVIETTLIGISNITGYSSNGSGKIFYDKGNSLQTSPLNNLGTGISVSQLLFGLNIYAKAFSYNSEIYLPIGFSGTAQQTIFIIKSSGSVVLKILPGTTSSGGGSLLLPEVVLQSPGNLIIPVSQYDLLTTVGGSIAALTGISLINMNFLSSDTYYKSVLGMNLNISGGILEIYDGQNVVEENFNMFPKIDSTATSNVGGGLGNASVATLYSYIATYEWTDNQGQIERSATSIVNAQSQASFASGVTTGKSTLTIETLKLTAKKNVRVVIYRTQGNGTIFYQVSTISDPLLNNPSVNTVTFIDTVPDSVVIGNALLYTTGGVVENSAPPASSFITSYKDRQILIPAENRNQFWFTKSIVPGTPLEYSESFTWNVDTRGGDLTGAAQLDDKLVLFKEDNVLYMTGDGPADTGANNDFSLAQMLPMDFGCSNARSIVAFPGGLVFQSTKGIWQLDRGLNPFYIGDAVEVYNSNLITSASLIPNTTQIRFTLDNGMCLVYDYYVKQWAVFTNVAAVDSTLFQNLFTYITSAGSVLQETIGSYTDNGSFIKLHLITSWLSFAKLQDFQRMKRLLVLGDWKSAHNLIIKIAYDFNNTFTQVDTIPVPTMPFSYEWRIDLEQQKSTAIQFSIEDSQTMPFGAGMTISNLNFMAGIKVGSNKLPPSQIYA